MSPEPGIEEIEARLFLQGIHDRYGYDLREYTATSIGRRLQLALIKSGAANLGELQHRVLHEPDLFASVLDDLTVRVSEMFRDPTFYRVFRDRVIPVLRTYPLLNIWFSGCAAGEEAYSAAIVLSEEGLYDRTQIYATDLSARALEQAKQGVYEDELLSTFEENYRQAGGAADFSSYYVAAYRQIALRESLRRKILFFQHNLVSDHVFAEMHLIFCRNVLIYFQPSLRTKVLDKLRQSLCPGGFLCLGSSERLAKADVDGYTVFDSGQRIYRYGG
jgi:chemotaxis protein methyltransferase CheR